MKTYVGKMKDMLHKSYNIDSKTTKEAQEKQMNYYIAS